MNNPHILEVHTMQAVGARPCQLSVLVHANCQCSSMLECGLCSCIIAFYTNFLCEILMGNDVMLLDNRQKKKILSKGITRTVDLQLSNIDGTTTAMLDK